MVNEKFWKEEKIYFCNNCRLGYKGKNTAQACENWCKKYGACSLEITKNAIGRLKGKNVELFNNKGGY